MLFVWIGAILLGALVPAALFTVASGGPALPALLFVAFVVALAHALVLGLPIALLYRAKRWQWPSLAIATGFLIGAAPIGIVITVHGIENPASWLDFLRLLGMLGGLGASGALAFWLTLRWAGALEETPESSE